MPKEEWGVKRVCPTCATRFYDLHHDPMTCPNCGATFSVESLAAAKPKTIRPEKAKPEPADLEDLPDTEEAEEDGDGALGDEILEDEEEDVDLEDLADVSSEDEES